MAPISRRPTRGRETRRRSSRPQRGLGPVIELYNLVKVCLCDDLQQELSSSRTILRNSNRYVVALVGVVVVIVEALPKSNAQHVPFCLTTSSRLATCIINAQLKRESGSPAFTLGDTGDRSDTPGRRGQRSKQISRKKVTAARIGLPQGGP